MDKDGMQKAYKFGETLFSFCWEQSVGIIAYSGRVGNSPCSEESQCATTHRATIVW
jgi:hypothetical protein